MGKRRTGSSSLTTKSTCPGLLDTPFFAHYNNDRKLGSNNPGWTSIITGQHSYSCNIYNALPLKIEITYFCKNPNQDSQNFCLFHILNCFHSSHISLYRILFPDADFQEEPAVRVYCKLQLLTQPESKYLVFTTSVIININNVSLSLQPSFILHCAFIDNHKIPN